MKEEKWNDRLTPYDVGQIYGHKLSKNNYEQVIKQIKEETGDVILVEEDKRLGLIWFKIDDERGKCFYQEEGKGIHLRKEHLLLDEFQFMIISCLLALPHGYFRGNPKELMEYMNYRTINKSNIAKLRDAIVNLQQKKYIHAELFDIENGYYLFYIKKYLNVDDGDLWYPFELSKHIRNTVNARSLSEKRFVHLVKVWLSMENQGYDVKFGYHQIIKDTELTRNQVINCVKDLKDLGILLGIRMQGNGFIWSYDDYQNQNVLRRRGKFY